VDRLKVGILGATGLVGQVFAYFLDRHPWFEVTYVGASKASAGKRYLDAIHYKLVSISDEVGELIVQEVKPDKVPKDLKIVFSALPSGVAKDIELELVRRGFTVISNAAPMRLDDEVPLINPEVNWDHLKLLEVQRRKGWRGTLVKNPNCTTAILTLSLKPIADMYGIRKVIVTSMQSVSGAGFPGVSSLQIIDNIIPFIEKEEEKMQTETLKIMGKLKDEKVKWASFKVSATCTRVPTLEGHMISVFVETEREVNMSELIKAMENFKSKPQELKLPTAPERPIVVRKEKDRPQTRLDRWIERGMSVVVGRLREETALDRGVKYVALGHNLARGAAGIAVVIAELMYKLGYMEA